MNSAWMCPVPLERSGRPDLVGMFSVAGDSMLFVDPRGRRAVNEKLPYNELAQAFFRWDGSTGTYPDLVLVQIWDQRSQDNSASDEYGRLIVPPGADDSHVIRGETLEELAAAIDARLASVAARTGGVRLADGFLPTLQDSIARFNGFAASGRDEDFGRGEHADPDDLQRPGQGGARPYQPDHVAARPPRARTTPRSSPAARSTPRAARAPRRTARSSTTSATRSPASTAWATASHPPPATPTGRAAPPSARSSPSPTAPRPRHTPNSPPSSPTA